MDLEHVRAIVERIQKIPKAQRAPEVRVLLDSTPLDLLSERELRVLRAYYGIGEEARSMSALARELGVSYSRVRQIRLEAELHLEVRAVEPVALRGRTEARRRKLLDDRDKWSARVEKAQRKVGELDRAIAELYGGAP